MKIALLAPRYHTNQISLVKFLLKNKHDVVFFVTRKGKSEDHSLLKPTVINLSVISKFVKFFFKSKNVLFDYNFGIPSIKELWKFQSNRFDLLIIRDPLNLVGLIYLIWSKLIGIKVILYVQREVYRKKNFFSIKQILESFLSNLLKSKIISPCLGNPKNVISDNKMIYLPFCLPASKKKKWFLNNEINILTIGKFVPRKKHLLLIRALSMIKVKNNFKLTIIGECTTKEHRVYLKQLKEEIKLRDLKVNILINVNPANVKKIFKKNDLFVLPSVKEPASVSNLEAMSFGLAVITTDTNQTSCYTEHGINGFKIKSNNIEDLVQKLELLLNNKVKLKKFGRSNLNIMQKKYNPEIVYKKFFETEL